MMGNNISVGKSLDFDMLNRNNGQRNSYYRQKGGIMGGCYPSILGIVQEETEP